MGRYKKSGKGGGSSGDSKKSQKQENFRNKNQLTSKDMPNYDKSTIDIKKFTEYSLNMNSISGGRDKAISYKRALGYDPTNYQSLVEQIDIQIKNGTAKMFDIEETFRGTKYKFEMPVVGPNGKTKIVIAIYQIDRGGNGIPRMVTNYLKKKGR